MRRILATASAVGLLAAFGSTQADTGSWDVQCRGYSAANIVETSFSLQADLDLIQPGCQDYGPDVPKLRLEVEYETTHRLHVKIKDRESQRYEIPSDVFPRPVPPGLTPVHPELAFEFVKEPFSFKVVKKSSREVLFDTSATALIFKRQYLRVKTWLPENPNIYGLGEHIDSFRLKSDNYTRTLWTRDSGGVPYAENLYGSHPVYVDHRLSGTHGVFLANSNGMDVKLSRNRSDVQFLEYNILGGVLDFYFLAGPSPTEVSKQYAEVIGKPAMVPYWSLGFHQCKYGYRDWYEVAEVVHNHSIAGIPLETMWTDIDYMDHRRIFSLDEGNFPLNKMQNLVKYLHDRQQRYILMVDPAVAEHDYSAYNRGVELDVFMKINTTDYFRGVVWPGVTVFPDWFHPNTTKYWIEQFHASFNPETGVDVDAIWIDMNEPASFCRFPCDNPYQQARDNGLPPDPPPVRDPPRPIPGFPSKALDEEQGYNIHNLFEGEQSPIGACDQKTTTMADHGEDNLLSPPYRIENHSPSGDLSDLTMYTNLQHATGLWTYDTHNIYGMLMGIATRAAMLHRRPGLRPFIITRSTFAGSGRSVSKWLGDNASRWDHYRSQIAQMLSFASIFQMPMVGSDVCGFIGTADEKLCARWATLGAFNPFYRNHADTSSGPQEFYRWPLVTGAAKYAIDIRYRLLDYLYTALIKQSADGTPTLNPLWYIYPQDKDTFSIDLQFFYGNCLLVSPVTEEGKMDVDMYLPDDLFYDWETREPVRGRGSRVKKSDIPFDRIPLHIRGGCILPLRSESANTTTELRKKPFELLVAPGLDGKAAGRLYVDDGISLDGGPEIISLEFEYTGGKFSIRDAMGVAKKLKSCGVDIAKVTILGEKGEDSLWEREEL